jgi:hypothetical protein
MKITQLRRFAMSLPEVTEQPHHEMSSFRVRGKIFVTVPPEEQYVHIFVADEDREPAIAQYPEFVEMLYWGKKVRGLRLTLKNADAKVVEELITKAWSLKAPKTLQK